MTCHWWSSQPVALFRARRTATATASAENPKSRASGRSAAVMAAAKLAWVLSVHMPSSAELMSASASSGSRKKSPLTDGRQDPLLRHVKINNNKLAALDLVLSVAMVGHARSP